MSEVVKDSGGIEVPISANLDQLKKGLEEVKRIGANPNKIQVKAEMSFDERAVAREYNKLVDGATRAAAQVKAKAMFGGVAQKGGEKGGLREVFKSAMSGEGFDPRAALESAGAAAPMLGTVAAAMKSVATVSNLGLAAYDYNHAGDRNAFREKWKKENLGPIIDTANTLSLGVVGSARSWLDRAGYPHLTNDMTEEEDRQATDEERYAQRHIDAMGKRADYGKTRNALRAEAKALRGDDVGAARDEADEMIGNAPGMMDKEAKAVGELHVAAVKEAHDATISSLKNVGRSALAERQASLEEWEGHGLRAFQMRQANERQNLVASNDDALVGKRGDARTAQEQANKKKLYELDAKQQIDLNEEVKRRAIDGEASLAAVKESNLRTQHQNYKADEVAFKASWQKKYESTKDLSEKAHVKEQALAAYGTFQQQQADQKANVDVTLKARRESADLRGRGDFAAAGVTELLAQQEIERTAADASDLPKLERTQAHELMAMRSQALRPHGYLQAVDPLSELPGGPGGDEGNQMVQFLSKISDGITSLVGLGGGAVLQ